MNIEELKQVRKKLIEQAGKHDVVLKILKNYIYLLVKLDSGGYRIYGYNNKNDHVIGVGSSNSKLIYEGLENRFTKDKYSIKIIYNNNRKICKSFKCVVKDLLNSFCSYSYGPWKTESLFEIFKYNYKFIANLADLYPWGSALCPDGYYYYWSICTFLRSHLSWRQLQDKNESNLKKVFGLNPKELKFLIKNKDHFTCESLKIAIKNFSLNWIDEHIWGFRRLNSTYWNIKGAIEFMEKLNISPWWYNDYLRMKELLPPELSKDFASVPRVSTDKELKERHDKIIGVYNRWLEQKKIAALKELNDKYVKEVLPKVKEFEYANDNYSIIACNELKDLVIEGSTLGHCVGSYTDSVGNGKEYILFLRKNNELDKPFYTINITTNNEIRQIHGKCNCNITKEIKPFITKWAKKFKLNASNYSGCLCHL